MQKFSFNPVWSTRRRYAFPNLTFNAQGGSTHHLAGGKKLGIKHGQHLFTEVRADGLQVRQGEIG